MFIRLLLGAAAMGVMVLAWRIAVRQSRLSVTSEAIHFPSVSGSNLNRQELSFPADFAGELNLLFVPFLQQHQVIVNTWLPFAEALETANPQLVYYELPTIDKRPMLSRTFINEGMRAGIPNPKARERTVTLYIDTETFRQATDIPGKDQVHILLVNRSGEILWRTIGTFDEEKGADLEAVVGAILGKQAEGDSGE